MSQRIGAQPADPAVLVSQVEVDRARAWMMAAIESLDLGLVMYDLQQRFVVCNAAYRRMFPIEVPLLVPGTHMRELLLLHFRSTPPELRRGSPLFPSDDADAF